MENTETKTEDKAQEEELKLSGDDIAGFVRKVFQAGNSRQVVWKDEDNKKMFGINLIIFGIIIFFIPILALIALLVLIILNHSLSIEKKKNVN